MEEDRDAVEIHIVQRHIERAHGNQLLCVGQYLSGKEKAAENQRLNLNSVAEGESAYDLLNSNSYNAFLLLPNISPNINKGAWMRFDATVARRFKVF
ncbi:hypothetical protein NYA30BAC_01210 [Halomonas sp. NYA30]